MTDEFNVSLDGLNYQEHIILFVDILGYSQLMLCNDTEKKKAVLELQKKLLDSDKSGLAKKVTKSIQENILSTKPITALLSDTIVYSYPIKNLKDCNDKVIFTAAYYGIANKVASLHCLFLDIGILIRGAATIGKIINHNGMAYGEGLAIANALQHKKQPFVYFDIKLIEYMKAYTGATDVNYFLRPDNANNLKYYDYFEHLISGNLGDDVREETFKRINFHVTQINQNLIGTQTDEGAHKKWCIVADYYDKKITVLNEQIAKWPSNTRELYSGTLVNKQLMEF